MTATAASSHDLILVGGGLQNGLIALACLARKPDLDVLLVERGPRLGGNHTWSFHRETVPGAARGWFEPLIEHHWPRYQVRFPGLTKTLEQAYATCSSEHFARVVGGRLESAPNATLRLGVEVAEVGPNAIRLSDGSRIEGALVVDSRGPTSDPPVEGSGFQRFVGLEVELDRAIDAETALLMDATVEQLDAFRFVYLLPFSPTRALVEDTYFANDPSLDRELVRERVLAYIAQRGLGVRTILREEHGVLPMPWKSASRIQRHPPLVAGYRGGWFHPATGYSVPVALRVAEHVAEHRRTDVFGAAFDALADEQERQARFAHLLNQLLFTATRPELRWKVFRHFYELPDDLTERFYGLTLTARDKRRMFLRRPPPGVSFLKAMTILPAWGVRRG